MRQGCWYLLTLKLTDLLDAARFFGLMLALGLHLADATTFPVRRKVRRGSTSCQRVAYVS
jgi:hypothetical protein